jgi:hypothetical protein
LMIPPEVRQGGVLTLEVRDDPHCSHHYRVDPVTRQLVYLGSEDERSSVVEYDEGYLFDRDRSRGVPA